MSLVTGVCRDVRRKKEASSHIVEPEMSCKDRRQGGLTN